MTMLWRVATLLGAPNLTNSFAVKAVRAVVTGVVGLALTLLTYFLLNSAVLGFTDIDLSEQIAAFNASVAELEKPEGIDLPRISLKEARYDDANASNTLYMLYLQVEPSAGEVSKAELGTVECASSARSGTGRQIHCFRILSRLSSGTGRIPWQTLPLDVGNPISYHAAMRALEAAVGDDDEIKLCDGSTSGKPDEAVCRFANAVLKRLHLHLDAGVIDAAESTSGALPRWEWGRRLSGPIQFVTFWIFWTLLCAHWVIDLANVKLDYRVEAKRKFAKALPEDISQGGDAKTTPWHRARMSYRSAVELYEHAIRDVRESTSVFGINSVASFLELRFQALLGLAVTKNTAEVTMLIDSKVETLRGVASNSQSYLRYGVWLIPTVGFIGTVIGIADALLLTPDLQTADPIQRMITKANLSGSIGVAFDTTFVALVLSIVAYLRVVSLESRWDTRILSNKDGAMAELARVPDPKSALDFDLANRESLQSYSTRRRRGLKSFVSDALMLILVLAFIAFAVWLVDYELGGQLSQRLPISLDSL